MLCIAPGRNIRFVAPNHLGDMSPSFENLKKVIDPQPRKIHAHEKSIKLKVKRSGFCYLPGSVKNSKCSNKSLNFPIDKVKKLLFAPPIILH